jgi:hypothetical protein
MGWRRLEAKSVGLVHIAPPAQRWTRHHECRFGNIGRQSAKNVASVLEALTMMCDLIELELPKKRRKPRNNIIDISLSCV